LNTADLLQWGLFLLPKPADHAKELATELEANQVKHGGLEVGYEEDEAPAQDIDLCVGSGDSQERPNVLHLIQRLFEDLDFSYRSEAPWRVESLACPNLDQEVSLH
jgi:hypothetical protein